MTTFPTENSMDIQPLQTQRKTGTASRLAQRGDLKWLGMTDDRELVCLAREVPAQNIYAGHSLKVFDGIAGKLKGWRLAQD